MCFSSNFQNPPSVYLRLGTSLIEGAVVDGAGKVVGVAGKQGSWALLFRAASNFTLSRENGERECTKPVTMEIEGSERRPKEAQSRALRVIQGTRAQERSKAERGDTRGTHHEMERHRG
jgi:hypothetical protein